MNTALWIIQALLAIFFIMPGLGKIRKSKEEHIKDGHLKASDSIIPIRILGILELLGCIGIILPWLTGICSVLTPVAAICFAIIMASGLMLHTIKRDFKMLSLLLIVLVLSAVVAYFRLKQLLS